jgi:hypothetical protein
MQNKEIRMASAWQRAANSLQLGEYHLLCNRIGHPVSAVDSMRQRVTRT